MKVDHPNHSGVMCVIAAFLFAILTFAFGKPVGLLAWFLMTAGALGVSQFAVFLIFDRKPKSAIPAPVAPTATESV